MLVYDVGLFISKEESRVCIESLLGWLGCSAEAITWLDAVQDDFERRGMKFRFCSDAEETELPLCAPGCCLMQVTVEELNGYCGFSQKVSGTALKKPCGITSRRVVDRE